jgi:gamma-glutamyltranspeptidase/glutathione hydrolase
MDEQETKKMARINFPSRRSAVLARGGMVATSQPLAAMAGLQALMDGGTAADAAVTTAAMLNVVEPMSTGIGGDCFALIYDKQHDEVTALNGSGRAPQAFTLAEAQRRGLEAIPLSGPLPVTVPGTASGWAALLARFGERADQRRVAACNRQAAARRGSGRHLPAGAASRRDPPPARSG